MLLRDYIRVPLQLFHLKLYLPFSPNNYYKLKPAPQRWYLLKLQIMVIKLLHHNIQPCVSRDYFIETKGRLCRVIFPIFLKEDAYEKKYSWVGKAFHSTKILGSKKFSYST